MRRIMILALWGAFVASGAGCGVLDAVMDGRGGCGHGCAGGACGGGGGCGSVGGGCCDSGGCPESGGDCCGDGCGPHCPLTDLFHALNPNRLLYGCLEGCNGCGQSACGGNDCGPCGGDGCHNWANDGGCGIFGFGLFPNWRCGLGGYGCGETYWGDFWGEKRCDPCDPCGSWTGPSRGTYAPRRRGGGGNCGGGCSGGGCSGGGSASGGCASGGCGGSSEVSTAAPPAEQYYQPTPAEKSVPKMTPAPEDVPGPAPNGKSANTQRSPNRWTQNKSPYRPASNVQRGFRPRHETVSEAREEEFVE